MAIHLCYWCPKRRAEGRFGALWTLSELKVGTLGKTPPIRDLPRPQCQPNRTYCTAGEALLTSCAGLYQSSSGLDVGGDLSREYPELTAGMDFLSLRVYGPLNSLYTGFIPIHSSPQTQTQVPGPLSKKQNRYSWDFLEPNGPVADSKCASNYLKHKPCDMNSSLSWWTRSF